MGLPRSGLLAANLLSLQTNLPLGEIYGFIENRLLGSGSTKRHDGLTRPVSDLNHILLLDDSILSGLSMREARSRIEASNFRGRVTYGAVYGIQEEHTGVDVIFEVVPQPRIFQWNLMHHAILTSACVDIDGVLCLDPTVEENDDGPSYLRFLENALPLHRPTRQIRYLVTSRLEKYRPQTEAWLSTHGIHYDELIMLNLASAEQRRRLGSHGVFKAEFYARSDARLFIESERLQAEVIARLSGKPVLCIETNHLIYPDKLSVPFLGQSLRAMPSRLKSPEQRATMMKAVVRAALGPAAYKRVKAMFLGRN